MGHRTFFAHLRGQLRSKDGQRTRGPTVQYVDGGKHEEFERHHGGNWISREAEHKFVPACGEDGWSTGANGYSCEMEFRAQVGKDLFYKIVFAHRNAAGKDEAVGFESALDQS